MYRLKFFLFIIVILTLSEEVVGQVYHIDPSSIHGLIPEEKLKNIENKILVWNAYKSNVQIWTSDNHTKWDTITINSKNGVFYTTQ